MNMKDRYMFWPKGFKILQNFQERFIPGKGSGEQGILFSFRQNADNQMLQTQKI